MNIRRALGCAASLSHVSADIITLGANSNLTSEMVNKVVDLAGFDLTIDTMDTGAGAAGDRIGFIGAGKILSETGSGVIGANARGVIAFVPSTDGDEWEIESIYDPTTRNDLSSLQADVAALQSNGLYYQGTWDANANSPAIPAAGAGNTGHYYIVGTTGTTDIDGESDWQVGDWIISNGTTWTKVDNSAQFGAEIKTKYEAQADTNAFTDAEKSKLGGIEAGATADQTGAEIKSAYEGEADTNAFTDAEKAKLAAESGFEVLAAKDESDLPNTYPAGKNTIMYVDNTKGYGDWGTVYTYVQDDGGGVNDSIYQVFVSSSNTGNVPVKSRHGYKTTVTGDTWSDWLEVETELDGKESLVLDYANNDAKHNASTMATHQRVRITTEGNRIEQYLGPVTAGLPRAIKVTTTEVDEGANNFSGIYAYGWNYGRNKFVYTKTDNAGGHMIYYDLTSWAFAADVTTDIAGPASAATVHPCEIPAGNWTGGGRTILESELVIAPIATEDNWIDIVPSYELHIQRGGSGTATTEVNGVVANFGATTNVGWTNTPVIEIYNPDGEQTGLQNVVKVRGIDGRSTINDSGQGVLAFTGSGSAEYRRLVIPSMPKVREIEVGTLSN